MTFNSMSDPLTNPENWWIYVLEKEGWVHTSSLHDRFWERKTDTREFTERMYPAAAYQYARGLAIDVRWPPAD